MNLYELDGSLNHEHHLLHSFYFNAVYSKFMFCVRLEAHNLEFPTSNLKKPKKTLPVCNWNVKTKSKSAHIDSTLADACSAAGGGIRYE